MMTQESNPLLEMDEGEALLSELLYQGKSQVKFL